MNVATVRSFRLDACPIPSCRALGIAALCGLVAASPARALAPGEDGMRIVIPVSSVADAAEAVAVDPDGRIVLAGSTGGASSALAGITRAGSLDSTFGDGGVVVHDLGAGQGDALHSFVRLGDGRYAGCGSVFGGATGQDFIVARFGIDGSLDTTFDGSGYAATPFLESGSGGVLFDQCNAVAVQSDGMIVSAGVTYETGPASVALTRHTAAGALDASFGDGGKVDINASTAANGNSEAHALMLQPDGKLLIAGYAYANGHNALLLMQLDTDGTPDASFGNGGITRTPVGTSEDIANAIVRQADGRIVIAGSSIIDGRRDFVLARYDANGTLDPAFGSGGLVTTPIGPGDDRAFALALMPWGRIVAGGSARISTSASGSDLALVAYNADGTLDRYFGDGGKRMIDVSDLDDIVYGLAADIGGQHFWAVGTASPDATQDFVAVEVGLPDTIFRHGFDTTTAP